MEDKPFMPRHWSDQKPSMSCGAKNTTWSRFRSDRNLRKDLRELPCSRCSSFAASICS